MNAHDAIKAAFATSDMVLTSYVSDMTDAELMTRPAGCNHIAWQLGHLISSEADLINMLKEGSAIDLPEGFADKHSKDTTANDDASQFCSLEEYLSLYKQTRDNSLATLATCSEEELDAEGPEAFRSMCPTMGSLGILIASHPMMHVGQFVPVRRALEKPIVI